MYKKKMLSMHLLNYIYFYIVADLLQSADSSVGREYNQLRLKTSLSSKRVPISSRFVLYWERGKQQVVAGAHSKPV